MKLEPVIGLEIHVQLNTKSKMFCACLNQSEDQKPNKNICPICTGHPGVLPTLNQKAVSFGLKAAVALNMKINNRSKFDRKSYFYPDLPKGYQISQYDEPLAEKGYLEIFLPEGEKKFGLERLHLEEDAAKNIHQSDYALIDFNRAGTPLLEIVSYPDFKSPSQAKAFLQELRLLMRQLEVSQADMEKGQLRCDANISLRPQGDTKMYSKTEIKNLNSFKSVERALDFEIKRQTELWQKNKAPEQQSTRGWDEAKGQTLDQRSKEEASDYRYFPEPDLPYLEIPQAEVEKIKKDLPELPNQIRRRFLSQYGFSLSDVNIMIQNSGLDRYAEKVYSEFLAWLEASGQVEGTAVEIEEEYKNKISKIVSNWLLNNLLRLMNSQNVAVADLKISPENFAEFLTIVFTRQVNSSAAQVMLEEMFKSGQDPSDILAEKDLSQVGGEDIDSWIDQVVKDNQPQIQEYLQGKEPIIKYLIGQVMKKSKGKADPLEVEEQLKNKLSKAD